MSRRNHLAVGIALGLVVMTTTALGMASAQDDDDPTSVASIEGDVVALVDQTTWVDLDGEIVVRVSLDRAPDDARVEVTLHEQLRPNVEDDFQRTLSRDRLGGRLLVVDVGTVAELDPAANGTPITIRLPIRSSPADPADPEERLGILTPPGLHPVDIAVVDTDGTRIGALLTHIVRVPPSDEIEPISFVLAQPLVADPAHRADGTFDVDRITRTSWTTITAALLAHSDQPVVLAPRAETIAALAAGGNPVDDLLLAEVARLAALGTVPRSTFVELDLDGVVRAAMGEELDRQLDRADAIVADVLDVTPDSSLWLAGDDLSPDALASLARRGVDTVLVHHETLDPLDPEDRPQSIHHPFLLDVPDSDPVMAMATDRHLQRHQGSTGDPQLDAQHLLANLADIYFATPEQDRAVLVELDADTDPVFIETLRRGIADSPLLVARTPTEAVTTADPLVEVPTDPGDPVERLVRTVRSVSTRVDLSGLRAELDLARLAIGSFATVFPDADDTLREFDQLLAVSASAAFDQGERSAYFAAINVRMDDLLAGIGLPEQRAITLPARDGTIPLTLTNATNQVAQIGVYLDSDKLEFPDGQWIELSLPPGATTTEVDVRARASGAFPLNISVESPDGRIELATARYTVRSTAVSGLGLAISVAAILVLGVWWVRTARRARATRREQAAN